MLRLHHDAAAHWSQLKERRRRMFSVLTQPADRYFIFARQGGEAFRLKRKRHA
jgi:hypothetical protein